MLPTLVKHISSDCVRGLCGYDHMNLRVTKVIAVTDKEIKKMSDLLGECNKERRAEFEAWRRAPVSEFGSKIVFLVEKVGSDICKNNALPKKASNFLLRDSCTIAEFREWYTQNESCELTSAVVMTVLESYLRTDTPLCVNAEDGPYRLESVQRQECFARRAFNVINWDTNSLEKRPTNFTTHVQPAILGGDVDANHIVLNMGLIKPNGQRTHILCDPTARQVNPWLPIPENEPSGVKFYCASTMQKHDKYTLRNLVREDVSPTPLNTKDAFENNVLRKLITILFQECASADMHKSFNMFVEYMKRVLDMYCKLKINWEATMNPDFWD